MTLRAQASISASACSTTLAFRMSGYVADCDVDVLAVDAVLLDEFEGGCVSDLGARKLDLVAEDGIRLGGHGQKSIFDVDFGSKNAKQGYYRVLPHPLKEETLGRIGHEETNGIAHKSVSGLLSSHTFYFYLNNCCIIDGLFGVFE